MIRHLTINIANCARKRAYDTHDLASNAARVARARSNHPNIDPYQCPIARHYHIGHVDSTHISPPVRVRVWRADKH